MNTLKRHALVLCSSVLLASCSWLGFDDKDESPAEVAPPAPEICVDRDEGCACPSEGQRLPCYADPVYAGTELVCNVGEQVCTGGEWSACEGGEEHRVDRSTALISDATACNPCNPACYVAEDISVTTSELTPDNSDEVVYDPTVGGLVSDTTDIPGDTTVGVGGDEPFDTDANPSEGVDVDTDGSLIIGDPDTAEDSIWIANTAEGTISRFSTDSLLEIGRFWTGPHGSNNDPSRTSLNTSGDAFVAGRDGLFITKFGGAEEACIDRNGNGVIDTSTNGTPLPWGDDECMIWSTDLSGVMPNGKIRAVAAQDIIDPVTGDVEQYVWVGGYIDRRISLIDANDGAILMTTYIGKRPYGFALDGSGNLWVSTLWDRRLVRIDTTRCNADYCPWNGVCYESSTTSTACDGSIKQVIRVPSSNAPYGITVDASQRVWIGGNNDVQRYEPSNPGWSRWTSVGIGSTGGWKAGIAVDGADNVWTAGHFGTWRINATDPSIRTQLPWTGWGVAVAADARIWIIGRNTDRADVITPGAAITDNPRTPTAQVLDTPYTYSDMTGQQLRLAAAPRGTYLMSFNGCGTNDTRWEDLVYDVVTPPNTTVAFRVRTGNTLAEVNAATWYGVGTVPPAAGALPVATVLDAAGVTHGRFAQVEVALNSSVLDPTMFVTPRVRSVQLNHICATPVVGYYQRTYDATESCNVPPLGEERPRWNELQYSVDTPSDSKVELIVQVADDEVMLDGAPEMTFEIPALADSGSINLRAELAAAGMPLTPLFLRVRARLTPSTDMMSSAVFYSMSTRWECRDGA